MLSFDDIPRYSYDMEEGHLVKRKYGGGGGSEKSAFSPTSSDINTGRLCADQISDELVRALIENRVLFATFPKTVHRGSFSLTDDAIVEFCAKPDAQDAPLGHMDACNRSFTKELFKRLVEASTVSTRTKPLHIVVSPVCFENEEVCYFAQHLSYDDHGEPEQFRIYDFPGEQHGADAAVDRQIVLHPDDRLELIRARRPHHRFYYWNE